MFKIAIAQLIFLGSIAACGGSSDENKPQFMDGNLPLEYQLIDPESSIEASEDGVRGQGSFVFKQPIPGFLSNQHFTTTFRIERGGFVDIRLFAQSDLRGGISLKIERTEDNNVKTTLSADHEGIVDNVTEDFEQGLLKGLDNIMTLRIDLHNKELGGHMLVWLADPGESLDRSSRVFNDLVGANGTGNFWGLVINRSFHQKMSFRL